MSNQQPEGAGLDNYTNGRMLEYTGNLAAAECLYLSELQSLPDSGLTAYEEVRRARAVMHIGAIAIDRLIGGTSTSSSVVVHDQLALAESKLIDSNTDLEYVAESHLFPQVVLAPTLADKTAIRARFETAKAIAAATSVERTTAVTNGRQLYRLANQQLENAERILRTEQLEVPSRNQLIGEPGDLSIDQFLAQIRSESNRYVMNQDGDRRDLWRIQNWVNAAEHEVRVGFGFEAWKNIGRAVMLAGKLFYQESEFSRLAVQHITRRVVEIGMPGMQLFRKRPPAQA